MARRIAIFALLAACGARHEPPPPEAFIRVGVDVAREADAVAAALEQGGYAIAQRIEGDGFVALAFLRESDGHRAVRVVTRIGVAASLDSHETDGFRERHGAVRLVEDGAPDHDIDGDGRPDVVVARDGEDGPCIAVLHIAESGRVRAARIESDAVAEGSCASSLEDVDGDRRLEALVDLSWPDLAIDDRVPAVCAPLVSTCGVWIADGIPAEYADRERAARTGALEAARSARDVATASRLGVELAALANLSGAPRAAQLARYDEALAGMVLHEDELASVRAVRALIAAGWQRTE